MAMHKNYVRTTIELSADVLETLQKEIGIKSKSEIVRLALDEMLGKIRRAKLIALKGKIHLDVDWEELRNRDLLK
jgi:Arc/MetJ family transcription regulator